VILKSTLIGSRLTSIQRCDLVPSHLLFPRASPDLMNLLDSFSTFEFPPNWGQVHSFFVWRYEWACLFYLFKYYLFGSKLTGTMTGKPKDNQHITTKTRDSVVGKQAQERLPETPGDEESR